MEERSEELKYVSPNMQMGIMIDDNSAALFAAVSA